MTRTVAIVQARTASTRLPAKIFLDLGGRPALLRCLERAQRIRGVDEVWVATTDRPEDELVVALARRAGVRTFRGSAEDVLERYHRAAAEARAERVVRLTSDCPLLDPEASSAVLDRLLAGGADYASNVIDRRMPRGQDTEAFTFAALETAQREARLPSHREHVTPFLRESGRFAVASVVAAGPDRSGERWTLDTLEDYCLLAAVFDRLGDRAEHATTEEVVALLDREPELRALNRHVAQKG